MSESAVMLKNPDEDYSVASSEALGDRLQLLHPGLLLNERYTVRPGCAHLKSFDYSARTDLPGGAAPRPGLTRPPLPSTRRQSSFGCRGTPASNIAYIHRCSIPNRLGTWLDYEGDKRGPHSSCIAVCPPIPAYTTDALTPRSISLCYGQAGAR